MTDFDHILNWELKAGSHQFPGPAGGTCINEAAIVAAGFEYKKVRSEEDVPPCFSRVLSAFAIKVNDNLSDRDRPSLMSLVTRLAGSAGPKWVEAARVRFIVHGVREEFLDEVAAIVARGSDYREMRASVLMSGDYYAPPVGDLGRELNQIMATAAHEPVEAIVRLCGILGTCNNLLLSRGRLGWVEGRYDLLPYDDRDRGGALDRHHHRYVTRDSMWRSAAKILTRAFEIGPRAPELDTAQVVERMAAAKEAGAKQAAMA